MLLPEVVHWLAETAEPFTHKPPVMFASPTTFSVFPIVLKVLSSLPIITFPSNLDLPASTQTAQLPPETVVSLFSSSIYNAAVLPTVATPLITLGFMIAAVEIIGWLPLEASVQRSPLATKLDAE